MKIVLTNLPWKQGDRWGVRAGSRWPHIKTSQEGDYLPFPFFLAYAGSLLKKEGFDVCLIDAIAEEQAYESFISRVRDLKPDFLVAETSTASLHNDMVILRRLKKYTNIIVCGPDVNIAKREFLEANKYIDFVMIGEYEMTLLDLLRHIEKKSNVGEVKGLIFRDNGSIVKNPDRPLLESLDALPWPMRDSLPMERYYDVPGGLPMPSVQMLASRGCPFQCIFCAWPQIMFRKGSYRHRNTGDVVDEMEHLVNYYGFKSIYFDDDTWNVGKERILGLCAEITKRKDERRLNVPWAMMARADLMDEEQLLALKKAGLHAVKYGIESSSQAILDRANKAMNLKKAERMVKMTMAMNVKTHLTFTFGLPGETKESAESTIDYALKLNPASAQFSITTPYPGTDYFKELDGKGRLLTREWSEYDGNYKSVFCNENLTAEELVEAKERACAAWGSHCRYREPSNDFPVRKLAHKFFNYFRTKGFAFSLHKTLDYLSFVVKRSDWYQRFSMREIKKGRLKILYGLGKVKIRFNNTELTKGVGMNSSVSVYENWFDSSQADWKLIEKTFDSVKLSNEWKYLPLKQVWYIKIPDEHTIEWCLTNIYKDDIEFAGEKAGIMLSEKYSNWKAGKKKKGEFKISRGWQTLDINEAAGENVGVYNPRNKIPELSFGFSRGRTKGVPQIQSSSRELNAKFIHINFHSGGTRKAGTREFLRGTIEISKEAK